MPTPLHPSLRDLRRLLDDYVDGAPFWPFWNSFMEHMETFEPERVLSPTGQAAYDDLYEQVYMAGPGPITPGDRAAGLIDAEELRDRIRSIRLESADGRLA